MADKLIDPIETLNALKAEIQNRLNARDELLVKIARLDGEIAGLRLAEIKVDRMPARALQHLDG